MGHLDARGDVAVGELAAYVPALAAAVYVGSKHGFGRKAGWYFLIFMALLHIVGAAMEVYAEINDPTNIILLTVGFSLSSASLSALMLSTLAILRRLQGALEKPILADKTFDYLGVGPILGLVFVATGGSYAGIPDTASVGQGIIEAGYIVIMLVILGEGGFCAMLLPRRQCIPRAEHKLLWAVALCMPFVFVRILSGVLTAFKFNDKSSPFSALSPSIWIEVFMQKIPEYIVAVTYLGAAILTPRLHPKAKLRAAVAEEQATSTAAQGQGIQYQRLGERDSELMPMHPADATHSGQPYKSQPREGAFPHGASSSRAPFPHHQPHATSD